MVNCSGEKQNFSRSKPMEDTLAAQEHSVDRIWQLIDSDITLYALAFIHLTFLDIITCLYPLIFFPFSHKGFENQVLEILGIMYFWTSGSVWHPPRIHASPHLPQKYNYILMVMKITSTLVLNRIKYWRMLFLQICMGFLSNFPSKCVQ